MFFKTKNLDKSKIIILILLIIFIITYLVVPNNIETVENVKQINHSFGIFTVLPTIITVCIAFYTSDVIFSLIIGIIYSSFLYAIIESSKFNTIIFMLKSITEEILNITTDKTYMAVLILCFAMGGFINIVNQIGGYEVVAKKLSKKINTPTKANIFAQLLALPMFFDDYVAALILGTVMGPICDKVKVSREKLAYIVDSTAAPLSGIAVISSWVGMELLVIESGLKIIGSNFSTYELFLSSIPFCYYCIFTLIFVLILTLSKKDIGPMLKAEIKARNNNVVKEDNNKTSDNKNDNLKLIITFASLILFILLTIYLIFYNGYNEVLSNGNVINANMNIAAQIFSSTEPIIAILESTVGLGILLIFINYFCKFATLKQSISTYVDGANNMFSTVLVLIMAWTLAAFTQKIGAINYIITIVSNNLPEIIVPGFIFIVCCIISFPIGSYGCMAIMMPLAISVANAVQPDKLFLIICIAQVLAGSIFGDHCSPLTDCTILASKSCQISINDHVKTQMPYAVITALISVISATLVVATKINNMFVIFISIIILILIVQIFGKNPDKINSH